MIRFACVCMQLCFIQCCFSHPAKISETLNGGHNAYSNGITAVIGFDLPAKAGGAAAQVLAGGGRPCMTNSILPRLSLCTLESHG